VSGPSDQELLVFIADVSRDASRHALEEAVGVDLYARAIHARVVMKAHYIAIILGPTGRAVLPLAGSVELLDFAKVMVDLTVAGGASSITPLALETATEQELRHEVALHQLRDAEIGGNG
jgi:hypothetical protein